MHIAFTIGLCAIGTAAAGDMATTNLVTNPGAEDVAIITNVPTVPGKLIPRGWGGYGGGSGFIWGVTTNEAHSGSNSVFMTFTGFFVYSNGAKMASSALMPADTDGYSGARAMPARPNTAYEFSFWLKGDVPRVSLKMAITSWKSDAGRVEDREYLQVHDLCKNGRPFLIRQMRDSAGILIPDALAWTRYSGRFATSPDTKRMALCIKIIDAPGLEPGQTIYVDDMEIRMIPPLQQNSAPEK